MFAEHVADIFASNGFTVFLFDTLRPTPELSFAIRELKCHSGVVVTASHNPKEYNGYKAYWTDGAQVTEPHDKNIIAEVEKITDVDMILTGKNPENITILDEKFDEIYLNKVHELSLSPESVKKHRDMKIVYSPDARRRRPPGARVAAEIRLHEHHHGEGAGRHRRELPPPSSRPTPRSARPCRWLSTSRPGRGPTSSWLPTPTPTVSASRCATRRASTCC